MGCCGKKIKSIVTGYGLLAIDKVLNEAFVLPRNSTVIAQNRLVICFKCPEATWLKPTEYIRFVTEHGRDIIKHFDDLEKLPRLPHGNYDTGKQLFCSICKCYVPAKVRVESEKCPKGKWNDS